jgi:hypothetical protein
VDEARPFGRHFASHVLQLGGRVLFKQLHGHVVRPHRVLPSQAASTAGAGWHWHDGIGIIGMALVGVNSSSISITSGISK